MQPTRNQHCARDLGAPPARASSAARRPGSASARILMSVYSCGPTPSPVARSWSAHGCPSFGEYTAYRLSFTTLPCRTPRPGLAALLLVTSQAPFLVAHIRKHMFWGVGALGVM
jgi:hypothetical protein